ncbi:hypothetical protein ABW19_dt0203730 [Dactylella cylindrospora]|nr:hypothetical protein ABW19_dt0203730 [Dactylella cylindrospora]
MNNSQFRKLINDTPRADRSSDSSNATSSAAAAAPLLGSRQRSSIPMTPRSVGYNPSSFAQQAAAYRLQNSQNQPKEKKFRSSAPLGSRLPQGYVDRTKLRDADTGDGNDDSERRMASLMKLVEEGSLTREEAIEQSKAFGGDLGSTHLVKGLDFRLLEKARRGDDVISGDKKDGAKDNDDDMEDELDKALEKEVAPVAKKRKDELDEDDETPAPRKKTRAEILEEFKKSRAEAAAKAAAENSLGSKFKKIGEKEKKVKASKEHKLSSKDSSSRKKRKRESEDAAKALEKAIGNGTVLGMLPPDLPSTRPIAVPEPQEDEDVNIFDDAPDEYDPLAGIQDSDDSDSDEGEVEEKLQAEKDKKKKEMPPPPIRPRNYFATSSKDADISTESIASKPLSGQDLANTAELSAAIKKASQMRELTKADLDDEEAKKAARHKAMLESAYRDNDDIDMGFGDSRTFGDDDEDIAVSKKKKKNKKKE